MDQILLYRNEVTGSIKSSAVIRIINSNSELLMEDTNIGEYSDIRDIIARNRHRNSLDELCMLETNNLGDEIGFENKIFYFKFNQKGLLEKVEQLLDTNKILNQLGSGKLDGNDDQLLVLDPFAGTLDYLRAFDHYALAWYIVLGFGIIDFAFASFIVLFALDLNILVSNKGDVFYTSYGTTSDVLIEDLYQKVPETIMEANGAEIVIGVSEAPLYDPFPIPVGRGYRPPADDRPYSIIFPLLLSYDDHIIAHEVGHNYGLVVGIDPHCDNFFCIMYFFAHPLQTDFCDDCENDLDEGKFGTPPPPPPPPPGGGCPYLYVFDGTEYVDEGLLDIHDVTGIDKVVIHSLQTIPSQINNKICLRLTEHPQTISYIDHIRLYGRLENGQWVSLRLKSAIHSANGEVRKLLRYSDDLKVKELGADHNNGVSETIDLEFVTDGVTNFLEFRMIIEGNNAIIK